jgi:predicted TIM-barrel fold metal-dependent hydrolase
VLCRRSRSRTGETVSSDRHLREVWPAIVGGDAGVSMAAAPEGGAWHRRPGLLPDPEPTRQRYTVISVDDHVVEAPDTFAGRMPREVANEAPRVITTESGDEAWLFDGQLYLQLGLNAVVGREDGGQRGQEPTRFDEMRRGCYDSDARIRDMDINGVWASLNFPSTISGFCGAVFARASKPAVGHAAMRAWNDWLYECWYLPHQDRIIPLGITWLPDPVLAVDEIRRNAERGFKAVSLPEQPHRLGLPSLHSGYWDPVIAACVDTGTVVCLHVGSSGVADRAPDAPAAVTGTLFSALSLNACVDWLWSGVAVRFPDVKIAMSEGGIGWVPMLIDRLDYIMQRAGFGRTYWMDNEHLPSEVLRRNFWFCTIDDPSVMPCRHTIGVDHIMLEVDYPHGDSTWPDTQDFLDARLAGIPAAEIRKITHENAASLFRHPLPDVRLPRGN